MQGARMFSSEVKEAEVVPEDSNVFDDKEFMQWINEEKTRKQIAWRSGKRNSFHKVAYNEGHIPHQGEYAKKRKERLSQWSDPTFNWPPVMPRPTMHRGKTLLSHIDSDERKRIEGEREFKMPNYRTGDVLELTMFQSLSEGKFNTFRGVVIGKEKPNNLRSSLKIHTVVDDVNTSIKVKTHSPMVAKIDVVTYGSNKNRKKLNHFPKLELSKGRLLEAVVKGRGYKHRDQMADARKEAERVSDPTSFRGKARRESVKLDDPQNY